MCEGVPRLSEDVTAISCERKGDEAYRSDSYFQNLEVGVQLLSTSSSFVKSVQFTLNDTSKEILSAILQKKLKASFTGLYAVSFR